MSVPKAVMTGEVIDDKSFCAFVVTAMDLLEEANQKGHVVYPKGPQQNPSLSFQQKRRLHSGMTTHTDLFEQYSAYSANSVMPMAFRLKPGISASQALYSLINSGQTLIDCGTGLVVAYELALLLSFEAKFGIEQGRYRFDLLFGSAIDPTPAVQRLLIARSGVLSGLPPDYLRDAKGTPLIFNPLAYFFELSPITDIAVRFEHHAVDHQTRENARKLGIGGGITREKMIERLPLGSLIYFQGDPAYLRKYPAGYDSGYNGVVVGFSSEDPLLRVFGEGFAPLCPKQLTKMHVLRYSEPSDPFNLEMLARLQEKSPVMPAPAKLEPRNVPGLVLSSNIALSVARYQALLKLSHIDALLHFRRYLNTFIVQRMGLYSEDILLPTEASAVSKIAIGLSTVSLKTEISSTSTVASSPDDYVAQKLGKGFMGKYGKIWDIKEEAGGKMVAEFTLRLNDQGKEWLQKRLGDCEFINTSAGVKVIIPIDGVAKEGSIAPPSVASTEAAAPKEGNSFLTQFGGSSSNSSASGSGEEKRVLKAGNTQQ